MDRAQVEQTRRALHRAVDVIIWCWPRALNDADARGWPPGRGYDAGSGAGPVIMVDDDGGDVERVAATGVEVVALRPGRAAAWVAELGDVLAALGVLRLAADAAPTATAAPFHAAVEALIDTTSGSGPDRVVVARVFRLADTGRARWPATAKAGATVAGVTVGRRGNTVETCGLCQQPVAGGHGDPIRRIDGAPFHKSPCWYQVATSRGVHPRQIAAAAKRAEGAA